MTTEYRTGGLSCPECRTALDPREIGDAEIDVCPGCAGIWVDWFDGDLASIARRAPAVTPEGVSHQGSRLCPRCRAPLTAEKFEGAELLRCAECVGAFVTRAACNEIAGAAPHSHAGVEEPPESLFPRVVGAIRDLLFGN